jgi:serine/threonine-protein kinase RsbW
MSDNTRTIQLVNDLAELSRLAEAVAQLAADWQLPPPLQHDLDLALEEVVCNVIRYGHPSGERHTITVSFERSPDELLARVEDSGAAFDPLARSTPDIQQPLEDRPVGGLGIYLVRQVMDEVHYQRQDNRNILTLKKRWPNA